MSPNDDKQHLHDFTQLRVISLCLCERSIQEMIQAERGNCSPQAFYDYIFIGLADDTMSDTLNKS